MPLNLPNLDDRTFKGLMASALALVPEAAPDYTEYNASDPGMTVVEALAWLTEIEIYRLNRLPESHYLKFLKLLGYRPNRAVPSEVLLHCVPIERFRFLDRYYYRFSKRLGTGLVLKRSAALRKPSRLIPAGSPFHAGEQRFETQARLHLSGARLVRLVSVTSGEYRDVTGLNIPERHDYDVFGTHPEPGDCFYLGFDRSPPVARPFRLHFLWAEDEPLPPIPFRGITHDARLRWEYRTGNVWRRMVPERDETFSFSRGGSVTLTVPVPCKPYRLPRDSQGLYYLRIRVIREGFDQVPRLRAVVSDAVTAVARVTRIALFETVARGEPRRAFTAHYQALFGRVGVQVRNRYGFWEDWERPVPGRASTAGDSHAIVRRDKRRSRLVLIFPGKKPDTQDGKPNLRIVSRATGAGFSSAFEPDYILGYGNGLPHQRFPLKCEPLSVAFLRLQIRARQGWRDWRRVDDFHAAGPDDACFVLDRERGILEFGDGIHGRVPETWDAEGPESVGAIRLIALTLGPPPEPLSRAAWRLRDRHRFVSMRTEAVEGSFVPGKSAESLVQAIRRLHLDLEKPGRAVTRADFESIARETPGLRVSRARLLSQFEGEGGGANAYRARLVVTPVSRAATPQPSKRFLHLVQRNLNRHRLIACEVSVIGPVYALVEVDLAAVVHPHFERDKTERMLASALESYLHPVTGGPEGKGWPFGRPVFRSELHRIVSSNERVIAVTHLRIGARDGLLGYGSDRDLHLVPHGLPFTRADAVRVRLAYPSGQGEG